MLFASISIVAFPRTNTFAFAFAGTIFVRSRDDLADRQTDRQTDKGIQTNARGGARRRMRQDHGSSQSTRYPRSLPGEHSTRAEVEGGRVICEVIYVYTCTFCILSGSKTERTLEREPVPERPLVRDRSISYLRIKGGRFVQFILNHGTVTGCQ